MIKPSLMIGFLCAQALFSSIAYADQPIFFTKPAEYLVVKMDEQDFNVWIAKLFEKNGFRKKFEGLTHKTGGENSASRYQVEYIFTPASDNRLSILSARLELMIFASGDPIYFEELEFKKFVFENNEGKRKAIETVFEAKELTLKNAIRELFQAQK